MFVSVAISCFSNNREIIWLLFAGMCLCLPPDDAKIAEFTATVASLKEQLATSQSFFAAVEAEFAAATQNWSSEKAAFTQTIAAAAAAKAAGA